MQRLSSSKHLKRFLLLLFSLGLLAEIAWTSEAQARAGKGRSFGQRSAPSYSRPAPQQSPNYATPPPAAPARGSFMKGLAGGIAGGLLGGMLFSSLGHAAGNGAGGIGGSGIGLLEILLLGGAAFLIYRLWKSRNQARYQPAYGGAASHAGLGANPVWGQSNQTLGSDPQKPGYFNPSWSQGASLSIDRETAEDLFFRVQGAWTRRDLGLVRDILSPEAASYLESDIRALKEHGHINRLENISIRQFAVVDTWQDAGSTFQKVRFTANLLDYTTDESGRILEGSDSIPVKFDEYWIFQHRPELARWQLAGIEAI